MGRHPQDASPNSESGFSAKKGERFSTKRKLTVILLLGLASLVIVSCGSGAQAGTGTGTTQNFTELHSATPDQQKRILADVNDDIKVITGVTTNPAGFSQALSGPMLDGQKKQFDQDMAKGRYRKRDYRNVTIKFEGYNDPVAELTLEFDDFGYYVDAKTGARLSQPTGQHQKYDMAVKVDGGRWKIEGLFAPSNASTPTNASPTIPAQ